MIRRNENKREADGKTDKIILNRCQSDACDVRGIYTIQMQSVTDLRAIPIFPLIALRRQKLSGTDVIQILALHNNTL